MSATQPWLVLLIVAIGTPLLALLLYFLVPIMRWLREPSWWFREIVVALLVGLTVLVGQRWIDDTRATRDRQIAADQQQQAERLENLRFVRDRASGGYEVRPFAGFDLRGMNLAGLRIRGADLSSADLSGVDLNLTDLGVAYAPPPTANQEPGSIATGGLGPQPADLTGANLCGANLRGATLIGADLSRANLTRADLSFTALAGANLAGADLTDAHLTDIVFDLGPLSEMLQGPVTPRGVYYDPSTKWPSGFQPPPPVKSSLPRDLATALIANLRRKIPVPPCTS